MVGFSGILRALLGSSGLWALLGLLGAPGRSWALLILLGLSGLLWALLASSGLLPGSLGVSWDPLRLPDLSVTFNVITNT